MARIKIEKIAVFCGAHAGNNPIYGKMAQRFAQAMINEKIGLVYGGAKRGLMGVIADSMLARGGEVIGVMPESLLKIESPHEEVTEFHLVESLHERKVLMAKLAQSCVLLPGGIGSLDEFFEMVTCAQIGYHHQPCGILNSSNYYDHLIKFLDHAFDEEFLTPIDRQRILIDERPRQLLRRLKETAEQ
ncbi:MAG: TIGR00730 family Rossman fold protein [Gammaproteobacteria bacterium]|nr:TIGR00730 family Rossman fold protein [Gammaproteobacteria bacterium]